MRISTKISGLAVVASTVALSSCAGMGIFSNPLYLAVTITPRPASVAQNGTVELSAVVSNNLSLPQWSLLDAADTASVGTLSTVPSAPNSILFTAPPAPPVYNSSVAAGFVQGTVTIEASVNPPSGSSLPVAHDSVTLFITAPTVTFSGISPTAVAVSLNTQQLFTAYELGSANNAMVWEVNGVPGGSSTTGTIDRNGVYTAPTALPMTGNTVTITVIPQALPNQSASAVVTLS